ncbi:MAG: hypothetical protein KIG76_06420 [Eubacteriales bacterium]|nr:hypothetical protein [Candidatus Colimorpha enterica]
MDSNLQPTEKRPTHRQIMLAVIITAVTAIVAALAHTAVLLFSYDSSLGVYIYSGYSPVMFIAGTVIGLAAVIIAAVSVPSGACGIERVPVCGTAEAFFAAMAGAAIFAYSVMNCIATIIEIIRNLPPNSSISVIISAILSNTTAVLWIIMTLLSIPTAAYLIISAVTKTEEKPALTALGFFPVLWTAVCLLRIYFDRTSAINNPVKIFSQMALAAVMLFFLSELRIRVGKPVLRVYLAFSGAAAMLGFSYSVSLIAAYLSGVGGLSGDVLLAVVILLCAVYAFSGMAAMRKRF